MDGAAIVLNEEGGHDVIDLPPGFRFHPTDEEVITSYVTAKMMNNSFTARAIGEVDLNRCEPWDLPRKAKMGEKEWFFFCQRDRKYPTGKRTNRATESGYWKATGKDREIYKGKNCLIGMKKTLVFYKGRAPKGEKSNWVMHEYRLEGRFSYNSFPKAAKNEWVVCRVFHKNAGIKPVHGLMRMDVFVNDLMDSPSLPPLTDFSYSYNDRPGSSFTDCYDDFKETDTKSLETSPDGNYLSYMNNHQGLMSQDHNGLFTSLSDNNYPLNPTYANNNPISNPISSSTFYPQFACQGSNFPYQVSTTNLVYLNQERSVGSMPAYPDSIFTSNLVQGNLRSSGGANLGTYNENSAEKQCKVEMFSPNQSIVSHSQDTGLSTDMPVEINTNNTSISKQNNTGLSNNNSSNNGSYDQDLEDSTLDPNVPDLDSLWN